MTTKAKIENHLGVEIPTEFDKYVVDILALVTTWIEGYTNNSFASSIETRQYTGSDNSDLEVDSFSFAKITDESNHVFTSEDYNKTPIEDEEEKSILSLNEGIWEEGEIITVTADFGVGFPPPENISEATAKIVASLMSGVVDNGVLLETLLQSIDTGNTNIASHADTVSAYGLLDSYK